ncbi:cation:proton antiporter [Patescibacteria group bacterium]|jgi:Kef-type K+ transport system membrane component KefB|nr:cation:proton antiporter [Patescibacteria group bacterium]
MDIFIELSAVLAVATVIAIVMQKLRLPLLLGHILTGMLAGPLLFNVFAHPDDLAVFSKLGITALLFIVGLSLNPAAVRDIGKVSVAVGVGQIVFTCLIGFLIALGFGYGWLPALYIALALTFSSTIIVLKILQDKRDLGKLYGRLAIGILLVQDLVATITLVLVSSSGQGVNPLHFLEILIKLFALGAGLWFVARFVLPRLTPIFAKSQEFLLLFSVAWGMGIASLFAYLGFSIEVGALAAGVALATSPYHHEITAKMKLLRDFFLVMFFVILGAELSFGNVGSLGLPILVFSLFVLIGNPIIIMAILGALGYRRKTSLFTGIALAQISEFSLVLILLAHSFGHVISEVVTLVTVVGLITFTGSSLLMNASEPLFKLLKRPLGLFERATTRGEKRVKRDPEAILFGFHRLGHDFLELFERRGRPFLVVDFDPNVIKSLQSRYVPCMYGDAADNELLDEFDLTKTNLMVSTIPDLETNLFLLSKLRKKNKQAVFMSAAQSAEEAMVLYADGADYVILPHYLGGNYASLLIDKYGLDSERIGREREKHVKHLETRLISAKVPLAQTR